MDTSRADYFGLLDTHNFPDGCGVLLGCRSFSKDSKTVLVTWDINCVHLSIVTLDLKIECRQVIKLPEVHDAVYSFHFDSILCMDKSGNLFLKDVQLTSNTSAMEVDESPTDSYTPEPHMSNALGLNVTDSGEGFCVLSASGDDLSLRICTASHGRLKTKASTPLGPKSCMDLVGRCSVACLRADSLSASLRRLLCPLTSLEQCDILLITLGSGKVLTLPLMATIRTPHPIFASYCHANAVILGGNPPSDSLLVFLSDDSVTKLSVQDGKLQRFSTLGLASRVVCSSSATALLSDTSRSWCLNLLQLSTSPLPIRGVTCAAALTPDTLFTATRHRALYWIRPAEALTTTTHRQQDKSPGELLDEIDRVSEEIARAEKAILEEDIALRELSICKRAKFLEKEFSISVKVHDSMCGVYNFDVSIVNNSEISIGPRFWSIMIAIQGDHVNLKHSQVLVKSFKPKETVRVIVPCQMEQLAFPLAVACSLVCVVSAENRPGPWCVLSLGSVPLDVSFFITPVAALANVQEYRDFGLAGQLAQSHVVRLPVSPEVDVAAVARVLGQNCAHRGLGTLRNSFQLALRVRDAEAGLRVVDSEVVISGSDLGLVTQLHQVLQRGLQGQEGSQPAATVQLDPILFVKCQSIQLALELAEAQGDLSEERLRELYKLLRTVVPKALPPCP